MALTLRESQAITAIAQLLYSFLPGSGRSNWRGHVTFASIGDRVGVGRFWPGGSKLPALTALLGLTLEHERPRFHVLVLEIVRAGILYRQTQSNPVQAEEIDRINGYLAALGISVADLSDPRFRSSLSSRNTVLDNFAQATIDAHGRKRADELAQLREDFLVLHRQEDRSAAGRDLERILNRLFAMSDLAPRQPFRVTGEQIDGSFELDHAVYLIEAKWEKAPTPEADLLVFRGKIEGKSAYTRGVFIAMNGVTPGAIGAITRGKQPTFFVIDGYDLTMILSGDTALCPFLRQRRRLLAEEGLVQVPYPDLFRGSRSDGPLGDRGPY